MQCLCTSLFTLILPNQSVSHPHRYAECIVPCAGATSPLSWSFAGLHCQRNHSHDNRHDVLTACSVAIRSVYHQQVLSDLVPWAMCPPTYSVTRNRGNCTPPSSALHHRSQSSSSSFASCCPSSACWPSTMMLRTPDCGRSMPAEPFATARSLRRNALWLGTLLVMLACCITSTGKLQPPISRALPVSWTHSGGRVCN